MPSGSRRSQQLPAEGSGALNWRRARIDGHRDGLIEIGDITPIAQHYEEQLSGYRVYRRGPQDTDWVLVPNLLDAESPLSIARPQGLPMAPVRYCFADGPDYPGAYDYYVISYTLGGAGTSAMEADAPSNIVQATLNLDSVDIHPPVWQDTEGIEGAYANSNGTVTVIWGEAVDEEHPPAPASPPVTHNLYYSTDTPLSFACAVKVADATSPWTSPQLVNAQEYFFAVRAQDSAIIHNEDQNAIELAVTIAGGIVDDQWPVWTEKYDSGDTDYYRGIRSAKVGNGQVEIVCADAVDELSPPIHYDLHYMSARVNYTMRDEDWNFLPEARVIEDIPKEYTFYWENRHEVLLLVYARDSASPPNVRTSGREVSVAPTDLRKVLVDPFLPGVTEDCRGIGTAAIQDLERRRVYSVYAEGPRDEEEKAYFVDFDVETGHWEAELLLDDPLAQEYGYSRMLLASAPSGALWSRIKVVTGTWGYGFYRYFHRPAGCSWGEIELPDPPDGFWNGILDQDEFPVFVTYGGAEEEGEYPLKLHFYEPESDTWRAEVACDYGAYPLAFWRPDGVMQLTTTHGGTSADDIPRYVMERSPDGEWTEALSGFGQTTALPITTPQWDAEIAWAVLTTMRGELELLTYGEEGYAFLPVGDYDSTLTSRNFDSQKDDPYIDQVWAAGSLYHALPYWLYSDGDYLEYSYRAADESCNWQEPIHHWLKEAYAYRAFGGRNDVELENGQLIWLDPFTGNAAFIGVEHNLTTKKRQVYMLTTFGTEASVFDPLTWE